MLLKLISVKWLPHNKHAMHEHSPYYVKRARLLDPPLSPTRYIAMQQFPLDIRAFWAINEDRSV